MHSGVIRYCSDNIARSEIYAVTYAWFPVVLRESKSCVPCINTWIFGREIKFESSEHLRRTVAAKWEK
ncbi:hypothetical protein HMPREF0591_2092 [Mycobacterium parascrofulaceum ATCC BAA-614]|uniref:Uncharacterized protein n=1 Tax=Mycobacterium parascrofulaceum ATCC BAA-614 TaxID=525368 RepID=D5P7E8_9MYCO|nr:hypothetical protein HMPREF0591_2092 [Mycobacterium parascrofulaceum ATCC BAA-614]